MDIPVEALELENRSIGIGGEPTLADAYAILRERWIAGDRNRELGLHLMFLAWYGMVEPPFLTGFLEENEINGSLMQTLTEVHNFFQPRTAEDAELLYAFGLAAHLFGFMFDDPTTWELRGEEYRKLYRQIAPNGIDPTIFDGREAYGDYYGHQARIAGGY